MLEKKKQEEIEQKKINHQMKMQQIKEAIVIIIFTLLHFNI